MNLKANRRLSEEWRSLGEEIGGLFYIVDNNLYDVPNTHIWDFFSEVDNLVVKLVQLKSKTRGHILKSEEK